MGMNPATHLKNLERIITGQGFKKVIPGLDLRSIRDSNGDLLVNGSTPDWAALETSAMGIVVASSQTAIGNIVFTVPRDYDQTQDSLRFRFLAQGGGTTDTPSIDASIYRKRAGAALSADLDPTISAVTTVSTTAGSWVEINADDLSIRPGDVLTVVFATGGTRGTTDALNLYALEVVYRSDIVYYDKTDRN